MKRISTIFVALVFGLVVGSIASAQKQAASGAKALEAADRAWERVFEARDIKGTLDACADNASVLAPNTPIATGKQAIEQVFGAFFALPDFKASWHATQVEVARSGELGYSTGVYDLSFKDPSGKTISDHGKYVTVWKKQANGWKVIYDTFNSDLPAAQ